MPDIQKITIDGNEYNAIEQDFQIVREDWNEYKLLDGGTVRVKTTVHRIFRVVDGKGDQVYNSEGDPEMLVRHRADVVSSA